VDKYDRSFTANLLADFSSGYPWFVNHPAMIRAGRECRNFAYFGAENSDHTCLAGHIVDRDVYKDKVGMLPV